METSIPQTEAPRYKLLKEFYADDTLIPEGSEIKFDGIPNEQMEPLNPAAEARMTEFINHLEEGRLATGLLSRQLDAIVENAYKNRPREGVPTGQVVMPKYSPDVPPMGHLTKAGGAKKPGPGVVGIISLPGINTEKPKPIVVGEIKDNT